MRIICLLTLVMVFCVSCDKRYDHGGKKPLVEVEGSFLYYEDLQTALPAGLSKDDSLLFAEHYIRCWAEDILLNQKAASNIPNSAEIERLVSNYRNSLIIHSYQQELISQKLSKDISDAELTEFYESNKGLFKLDRPLVKGLFIKIPITAPRINDVRKWYKSDAQESLDQLEKYSFQNALKYEYFRDNWLPLSEISDLLPLSVTALEEQLATTRNIELKDSLYYYFLSASDLRTKGQEEPYEFAKTEAREMLINNKQLDFMKQVKDDLYRQALKRNKIKYNYLEPEDEENN